MKVLDDMAICKVRARLRAQAVLQTGPTPAEVEGKRVWVKMRRRLLDTADDCLRRMDGFSLSRYLEKDVVLTAICKEGSRSWKITLRGRVDAALLVDVRKHLLAVLFEVTEYTGAPWVAAARLQAYASSLYGELGLPVIPVLIVMSDEGVVKDALVMKSREPVPGLRLRKAILKLVEAASSGEELRPSGEEVCVFCDPSIRRICPHVH